MTNTNTKVSFLWDKNISEVQSVLDNFSAVFNIKGVKAVENIKDVPEDYLVLHMLSNGIKEIKKRYEKENKEKMEYHRLSKKLEREYSIPYDVNKVPCLSL